MINQAESYLKPLISILESQGDPNRAEQMKKYLKGQFEFFGIKADDRRSICKTFLQEYGLPKTGDLSEVVYCLWDQPQRELQHFAMEVVERFSKRTGEEKEFRKSTVSSTVISFSISLGI